MNISNFFDKDTSTYTYILEDSKSVAVIDPVLGFDLFSGRWYLDPLSPILDFLKQNGLRLDWILETHIHADHISGAKVLQEKFGGKIGVSASITKVLEHWVPFFGLEKEVPIDGSQFDHLIQDQEIFKLGNTSIKAISTPGHTPACVSYHIEDSVFVGDTIFMPYVGTARTDFPGGNAGDLYDSIQKIYSLPNQTKLYVGHDYPLEGQSPISNSTVQDQKLKNILINQKITKEEFVKLRNERDLGKAVPRYLFPSIQLNINAGRLPQKREGNFPFLKIPFRP